MTRVSRLHFKNLESGYFNGTIDENGNPAKRNGGSNAADPCVPRLLKSRSYCAPTVERVRLNTRRGHRESDCEGRAREERKTL